MEKGRDKILITGATGQQGGAIAGELLDAGYRVRAMTRHPEGEQAKALAARGAEVVHGDLDDSSSVEQALDGVWGAFAVQNTWEAGVEGEERQGLAFAESAKTKNLQHLVYGSVGSAHRNTGIPHFENKWRVEQKIRELGFPSFTILRPVFFMENWTSPWFKPYLDQGTVAIGMKPDTSLQMVAVEDIGKYGKMAFERHAELNGQSIDFAGDDLTGPQVAETLTRVTGRPFQFFQVPIEDVRKGNEEFALMLEWFDAVGYDADIEGNAKRYGIAPTRFEPWARKQNWD